jgi:hypothetical protein
MIERVCATVGAAHPGEAASNHCSSRSESVPSRIRPRQTRRQIFELASGEALRAVHGSREPSLAPSGGVDPLVDAKLPGVLAALSHRSVCHGRGLYAGHRQAMGNSWARATAPR